MARPRTPAGRARRTNELLTLEYPGTAHDLCELDHRNPFELLTATIMSAQTTDVRVNMVTPVLFAKYPDAEALARALREVGVAPADAVDEIEAEFGWQGGLRGCRDHGVDGRALAAAAVAGGNPVIPLVGVLKERLGTEAGAWVHRGATSQDILDTALMIERGQWPMALCYALVSVIGSVLTLFGGLYLVRAMA